MNLSVDPKPDDLITDSARAVVEDFKRIIAYAYDDSKKESLASIADRYAKMLTIIRCMPAFLDRVMLHTISREVKTEAEHLYAILMDFFNERKSS